MKSELNQDKFFGVLFYQVIASGRTKKELRDNSRKIFLEQREKEIYFIKI
jgi:hypothetical protein